MWHYYYLFASNPKGFNSSRLHQPKPTRSSDYPSKAKRPAYSALDSALLKKYGIEMPQWKDTLRRYLEEKGHF